MGQFALNLSGMVEKKKLEVSKAVRTVMLDLFTRTVMKTPVDTGMLRNSWWPGVGTMPTNGEGGVSATGAESIARIQSVIGQVEMNGEKVYLMNNLPYARAIEYGHSKVKAPQGMVRLSVQEIVAKYGK